MSPTREQIEVAAYHRWTRRGGVHGGDHDDWSAAEKDLTFGLNYRYTVRLRLDGPPVPLGKDELSASGLPRRCRFCEQAGPPAAFADPPPPVLPAAFGHGALRAWDECDDCRGSYESGLAAALEAFARPLLGPSPALPRGPIPAPALKALVRAGLSVAPRAELHHFGDTVEWLSNPDHARDAAPLADLGCHVYLTPAPVPSPFVALARRVSDDAPWPYMLFFLATSRVVIQTHLPLCSRDEDLDGLPVRGPELSMSLGSGPDHRASPCVFLPVALPSCRPTADGRVALATAGGSGWDRRNP